MNPTYEQIRDVLDALENGVMIDPSIIKHLVRTMRESIGTYVAIIDARDREIDRLRAICAPDTTAGATRAAEDRGGVSRPDLLAELLAARAGLTKHDVCALSDYALGWIAMAIQRGDATPANFRTALAAGLSSLRRGPR